MNLYYFLSVKMGRHRVSFRWTPFACPGLCWSRNFPAQPPDLSLSPRSAWVTSVAVWSFCSVPTSSSQAFHITVTWISIFQKLKAPIVFIRSEIPRGSVAWVVEVGSAWKLISAILPLWPPCVLNRAFNYYYSSCFLTLVHHEPFSVNKKPSVRKRE